MSGKTIIVDSKSQMNPNGTITGANNILYQDFDAVDCLYNSLAEYFTTGKVSGTSHLGKIIQKDFELIEKSLKNNDPSLRHIKDLMDITGKVQEYRDNKKATDKDFIEYLLRKNLFDWQKAVFDDNSKKIDLICGRRSGKSYTIVDLMLKHCNEGSDNIEVDGRIVKKPRSAVYIGLTLQKAANNVWQLLKDEIKRCKIPTIKIDNSAYRIDFANGAFIELAGNSTKAEREKIRGKDSSMFIIDEAQSHQGLGYLITSIIQPIVKGRNGTMILSGTGPITAGGMWEQIINDKTWSKHTATMEDNPTIPVDALQDVLKENGWDENNITYRREYLGQIVYDANRLIVPNRSFYTLEDIKNRTFDACIIGMDYGYSDYNAFVPIIRDSLSKKWYVIDSVRKNHLSSSEIVNEFFALSKKIEDEWKIPKNKQYAVADTSHQQISRDIYNKGFYNISNSEKLGEVQMFQDLSTDCSLGNVNVIKGSDVDNAFNIASWKFDEERQAVIYEVDDVFNHSAGISDIADAMKYAHHLTYRV
jgi:hypothetical protein